MLLQACSLQLGSPVSPKRLYRTIGYGITLVSDNSVKLDYTEQLDMELH